MPMGRHCIVRRVGLLSGLLLECSGNLGRAQGNNYVTFPSLSLQRSMARLLQALPAPAGIRNEPAPRSGYSPS
jgi:hypothetical protein